MVLKKRLYQSRCVCNLQLRRRKSAALEKTTSGVKSSGSQDNQKLGHSPSCTVHFCSHFSFLIGADSEKSDPENEWMAKLRHLC
ncbi:MAG TPA: hypothetical protein VE133_18835, partial [Candidatus Sulfotelmatobacter sp.]|nr:hypothetical protein [Candidatus Sulfotelmatobacter sp.]